nr:substrate-binding domain-containing protein [Streptomyces canus]
MRTAATLAIIGSMALTSACSTGQSNTSTSQSASSGSAKHLTASQISLVYAHKLGTAQYMIDEGAGAERAAAKLGVKIRVVDLGSDVGKTVSTVQEAIAQKASGIVVVPPDDSVGPQISALATGAGIPLISSDDQVCTNGPDPTKCSPANLLPRVGFDATEMGKQVGAAAAGLYPSDGSWTSANTVILQEWAQQTSVCTQRVKAAVATFGAKTGTKLRTIKVGTNTTVPDSTSKTAAVLNGNRGVKHWVVFGCADEDVQGAVQALQSGGYAPKDIVGVGVGGNLACKDWQGGTPSGMKAALFISGAAVGAQAVELMVDHLTKGTPFPAQQVNAPTVIVNPSNWKAAGLVCH